MSRYMKREDAIFAACKVLDKFGGCSLGPFCPDSGCREVREVFENVPAADAVEVVRCRDCVYWRGENDCCEGIGIDFSQNGYCSFGERKDGGQDDG